MQELMFTEEDKQAMIELIEWYRDEYHRKDFGHSEMIEKIKTTSDAKELKFIESIVDGWIE